MGEVALSDITASEAVQRMRGLVQLMYKRTVARGLPTSAYHWKNLRLRRLRWTDISSGRTCLVCIRRRPECVLSCAHTICEVCIQIFGSRVQGTPYRFEVKDCVMCGLGTISKTLMPPTAAPRLLAIDGGGVGGVIPLEFLGKIQSLLGDTCPVQQLFDLVFGTSSGESARPMIV